MTDRLIVRRGYIIMIIGLENVTDSYHYLEEIEITGQSDQWMPKIYWSEQNFTGPTKKSEKKDKMEPFWP
jgi:hypothetical protein